MLRRGGGELQAGDADRLPPIQLPYLGRVHAPAHQQVAHAQRGDKHADTVGQRADGGAVEMVVVVMRQDHPGQRRQRIQCNRRGVETLGPGEWHRRGAFGKHRVGQPQPARQLHQQRGMAQPVQAAIQRGQQVRACQRLHRQGRGGHRGAGLAEHHGPHQAELLAQGHDGGRQRHRITEAASAKLWRIGVGGRTWGSHGKSKQDVGEQKKYERSGNGDAASTRCTWRKDRHGRDVQPASYTPTAAG